MALVHTLMNLRDEGLVDRFDLINEQRARVHLISGRSIIVYMSKDYIVGVLAITEAVVGDPRADYIVYNHWDCPTELAFSKAKELGVPFLIYSEFKRRIRDGIL